MKTRLRFLFAAGGTGGHIFPALALAEEIKRQHPSSEILFIGSPRGLESHIIPKYGFCLKMIPIGRLNKNVSLLERIKTLFSLPWAFLKSLLLILKFKPQAVIGVGGYASGPVLLASALLGLKSFIWEPNAYPGMANRYLSRFVDKAYVIFENAAQIMNLKNYEVMGYPLRKDFDLKINKPQHNSKIKLTNNNLKILVFGGSQGSKAINDVMVAVYRESRLLEENFEFIHQTGSADYERLLEVCTQMKEPLRSKITLTPFIEDMVEKYIWADIAICRAGMGTVSELAAMGVPAVFIPLPNSADNHQVKNAEALVKREASIMILQQNLDYQILVSSLKDLGENKEKLKKMSENIAKFHEDQSCFKIVKSILNEISNESMQVG